MRIFRIITGIGITLLVSSCSVSTFGKFQADEGIPSFIQVGKTTRKEIMTTLGEPLVHRFVVGKETLIYNHERGEYFFLLGWGFDANMDPQLLQLLARLNTVFSFFQASNSL